MKRSFLGLTLLLSLSACNLYGGLSKPSNDDQYLLAARACLDHGDYDCALSNYQALSLSYNDIKISETSLTSLASNNIFSMKDLVSSLGTGTGNGISFTLMADLMASRGKTTPATRVIIQQVFSNDAAIASPQLKAFAQFTAALAMFNALLATAVRSGVLLETDLVDTGGSNGCTGVALCALSTKCDAPSGTNLTYDSADATVMTSAAGWTGSATLQKLIDSASKASAQLNTLSGTSNYTGLMKSIQALAGISLASGATDQQKDRCTRQALNDILFH